MKHADLVRLLESMGCVLIRHGGKHDWYQNPATKVSQPVPRHKEIADGLSKPQSAGVGSVFDREAPLESQRDSLLVALAERARRGDLGW